MIDLSAVDLHLWGSPVTRAEWMGALLGLAMVVCNARLNPLGWPLAIASSVLYALVFTEARLYGQALLQLVFIAMSAWGWRQWVGHNATPQPPQSLSPRGRALSMGATAVLWLLIGLLQALTTDNPAPFADALPTAGSLVALVLLARRRIENWAAWSAVNAVSVLLFAQQGLWPTTALYAVMTVMSVWGWRQWRSRAQEARDGA